MTDEPRRWADRNFARHHDDFRETIAIANMHDALLAALDELVTEQRRTNQLLEWIGQRLADKP